MTTTARCRAQGGPSACDDPDCPQRIAFYAALTAERPHASTAAAAAKRGRAPWETRFQELQTWVAAHGSMPHMTSAEEQERRLATWIANQKAAMRGSNAVKKAPTEQQQALLTSLDPTWLKPQRNRNRNLQLNLQVLEDFLATEGRAPRYDATAPTERALYAWASKQRTHGDTATKTVINRLLPKKQAGRAGGANLQQLRDFVATTGHSPRRSAPAGSTELALHTWALNHRRASSDPAVVAEINRLVPKRSRGSDIFVDDPED